MSFLKIFIIIFFVSFNSNVLAKSIDEKFKEADNLIEIDQTKEALELLKKIQPENDKQTAEQFYLLARLYYSLGKFSKANDFYMDASLLDPSETKYQVGLSQTSFALGKLKLAERYANIVLRNDPDLIEAELILALVLNRYGKKQLAEKRFLDLIELQPSNKKLFLNYAKFLEQSDKRQRGIKILEDFIIKNPNSPDLLDYLGRLYWFNGQSELAIEKREAAAKLYKTSGKFVMTVSITEWVNSVKEKIIAEKKKEEEKKKKALPPKPKQKFTPNPGNEIEPFPDYYYDHPASTGSGFIINEGRQILTNKHVIEGSYKIYVRNGFGELRYATVEKISQYDDLALLTLDTPFDPAYSLTIPDNYQLRTGQTALVMGFPLTIVLGESSPSLTEGIVSKTSGFGDDPGTYQLTSKLNKGNSGGPIFSDTGELIGVAVQKIDTTFFLEQDGYIIEDVNIAIQIDRVKRFIQSSEAAQELPKLDLADLYELKLPSVVMILNILPKEEKIIETSEEDEINKAIEACQSDYDSKKYPNVSRKQFNELCVCYINGLAKIYDEEEDKHRANYNKPSDKFLNEEEKIIEYCASKIK
mgnify:CR=1 FL=1